MTGLFVRQLTVIDFSYLDAERGIVGESWMVDVTLYGDLDEQGMVFDFGHVKKQIKQAIDGSVDHCLVVPGDAEWLSLREGDGLELTATLADGSTIEYSAPKGATTVLQGSEVTLESVETCLQDVLLDVVPKNVRRIELALYPEVIDDAYYHYSHGLKKHEGDCQRIAHGHRSRIEICVNGERDSDLEATWARRWQDIYLITREDIVAEFHRDNVDYVHLAYRANQGAFSLVVPKRYCELLDTDSTVELIAQYIAQTIKQDHPEERITVYAYEGVNKGAISHA